MSNYMDGDLTGEFCRVCGSQNLICGDCPQPPLPSALAGVTPEELRGVAARLVSDAARWRIDAQFRAAAILRALADSIEQTEGEAVKTYEFQVYCNDEPVAGASGPDRERALSEAINYAAQYREDGPVVIEEVKRAVVARLTHLPKYPETPREAKP